MVLCSLGDLLLDVIVRLDEPLRPGGDVTAATATTPGGQAANVAAWAAALGAEARFVGKRGADDAGALVAAALTARGVAVLGPVDGGPTGTVVSLVVDGDRTMASDRGVAPDLRADELDAAWLAGCDWLHLTGYGLLRPPVDAACVAAARLARAAGARVSLDLSSAGAIRAHGPERFRARIDEVAPDVLFANEHERDALGVSELPGPTWVLKRGAAGCVAGRAGERHTLSAVAGPVVDPTGAGDALVAGVLVGLSDDADDLPGAAGRGLAAAARCVASVGAMP